MTADRWTLFRIRCLMDNDCALTVVDNFTRESLAIAVEQGIKGDHVAVLWAVVALARKLSVIAFYYWRHALQVAERLAQVE